MKPSSAYRQVLFPEYETLEEDRSMLTSIMRVDKRLYNWPISEAALQTLACDGVWLRTE